MLLDPLSGQPNGQKKDRILKHNPEPPAAHVMRRERAAGLATRAQFTVTRTIGS